VPTLMVPSGVAKGPSCPLLPDTAEVAASRRWQFAEDRSGSKAVPEPTRLPRLLYP